ncbi:MAG: AI-2E family transporter [Gemmataceae bacterium]
MTDRKLQARWLAVLAGTAVAVYGCWLLVRPFLGVLTWSVVLVVTFYPVHRRLTRWLGRPGWSALLSTGLVAGVVLAPAAFAALMIARELPGLAKNASCAFAYLFGPQSPLGQETLDWLGSFVDLEQLRSSEFYLERARELSGRMVGPLLGMAGGVVDGLVQAVFVVFATFFLFRDGAALAGWLRQSLPLEEAQNAEIIHRTHEMIEASMYGVVVLAVLQGVLGGMAFLVLGLPNPFIWGAVMIVLSTIPVAGSFVVWVPAAGYLAATGEWGEAVALVAWGTLVIGTVDNFLRPVVMGQKARMHELLLFFAVLGGLVVFGVAGLVLGPVLVAVTLGLIDVIRQADRPAEAIRREPGLAEQTARIADGESPRLAAMR